VNAGFFGGRLDMIRLKLWQKLFVMLIVQAPLGGSIDQAFIRAWAAGLFGGWRSLHLRGALESGGVTCATISLRLISES